jgi:hypothetical protein
MMVFRRLEQDIKGFNDYLKLHGKKWRERGYAPQDENPTDDVGSEFLWGHLIEGRKSVRSFQ